MWLVAAFLTLGFLVGNLAGLSSAAITNTIIGLLFAFGGGSAVAFLQKLDANARVHAGRAIFAISFGCLFGVYTGILVAEHQLLTPERERHKRADQRAKLEDRRYTRGEVANAAHAIDQHLTNGRIELREAYRQLYDLATESQARGSER
jgi:hypothetical protein